MSCLFMDCVQYSEEMIHENCKNKKLLNRCLILYKAGYNKSDRTCEIQKHA